MIGCTYSKLSHAWGMTHMSFRAGDRVVVKSQEEILASLDRAGELESMPYLAEMLTYCGQELRVSAVAHKTCDTINKTGGRRVRNAVHLDGVRCDGLAHGGCQAACLIFWKTEWLRPAGDASGAGDGKAGAKRMTVDELQATGSRMDGGEPLYSCQATRLFAASSPLPWWDMRQYLTDVGCGNVGLGRMCRVAVLRAVYHLRRLGIGYRATRRLYDKVHELLTGRPSPYRAGLIPGGQPTPLETLNLAGGEWVEVRTHDEIRRTITEVNVNRGMRFDPEMVQFCGRKFRVDRRVERLIDERTGRMLIMKSPCIVLDGAVCSSEYSDRRIFCPRAIQPYFREIWLRRSQSTPDTGSSATT